MIGGHAKFMAKVGKANNLCQFVNPSQKSAAAVAVVVVAVVHKIQT